MVMASMASIDFNWQPNVVQGDDPQVFSPNYLVVEEAKTTVEYFRSKFASLPSSGIWEDRTESNDELLEQLGGDWRGFAIE